MTGSVVTLGETMALLTTPPAGRITGGTGLTVGIGGAESNVAIALARLDVPCTWISRVGDDALGALVVKEIRGEGVDVVVRRDDAAPTGMMLKELRGGRPWRVRYYRRDSAASRLSPDDVDEPLIASAAVLHLTGITPALGPGPLAAVERAIAVARAHGTLVSFDVNHRRSLWPDEVAAPVLARLAAAADLLFAGPAEATLVLDGRWPSSDEATVAEGAASAARLASLGPTTAVVKLGALGAVARDGGESIHVGARAVEVVDTVGAGDAFVGGYLAELAAGRSVRECLATATALGTAVCAVPGDWEGIPTRAELAASDLAVVR
ncbi:2-dehydro-3-deoxygluconokinase [Amycolatopsis lexingtonensis]|uniref:2-dehydro-3-deoxygluconokinase n=1 Tax=Amycolatopsis lexingtonensis TaxID=218822 RepID=A0ABR9HRU3_9PSEU|nr:sugar kinase [Amycolatopsis lexingtonensis]MBE1493477.1 2-dehydro-3-deoxygluconokinase [Amycolatopsis lexingtonensis]